MNMRMKMPDNYNIQYELKKVLNKIKNKYKSSECLVWVDEKLKMFNDEKEKIEENIKKLIIMKNKILMKNLVIMKNKMLMKQRKKYLNYH